MMSFFRAKRGDGVAWKSTVSYVGDVCGPTVYYRLGRVTSVTRDGEVRRAKYYTGTERVEHETDLRGIIERYIIPADQFDINAMLNAYAVENPVLAGKDDDEAVGKLRAFVARFRRDGRGARK